MCRQANYPVQKCSLKPNVLEGSSCNLVMRDQRGPGKCSSEEEQSVNRGGRGVDCFYELEHTHQQKLTPDRNASHLSSQQAKVAARHNMTKGGLPARRMGEEGTQDPISRFKIYIKGRVSERGGGLRREKKLIL